jgi:hypothetical protein
MRNGMPGYPVISVEVNMIHERYIIMRDDTYIGLFVSILFFAFIIFICLYIKDFDDLKPFLIVGSSLFLYSAMDTGIKFQYVIITSEQIVVKNMFGSIICSKKWYEIRSIKMKALFYEGQHRAYIVFYDGNKPNNAPQIKKNSAIKIACTKRNLKIVEQFWKKEISL